MSVKIYSIFFIFYNIWILPCPPTDYWTNKVIRDTSNHKWKWIVKPYKAYHVHSFRRIKKSEQKKIFTDSFSHRVLQYMLCLGCSMLWPGIATEGLGCRMLTLISAYTSLFHFSPVCLVGGTELLSSRAGCKSFRGQCFLPPSISFL